MDRPEGLSWLPFRGHGDAAFADWSSPSEEFRGANVQDRAAVPANGRRDATEESASSQLLLFGESRYGEDDRGALVR